jgi:hypothetical protein
MLDNSFFIPDSAVGADRKRDAQSFRSAVDRFLPLRIDDQRCFEQMLSFIAAAISRRPAQSGSGISSVKTMGTCY